MELLYLRTIFLFFCSLVLKEIFCVKLSAPFILLPVNFQKSLISYTLEVKETAGECFKWSSMREDVVSVRPTASNGCSNTAVLTVLTHQPGQHKVIVLAEDPDGGTVLRCDVTVDMPVALAIASTAREIYVEEAAEQFELVAHDAAGNQFSSLAGLAFEWLVSSGQQQQQPVIKIQPFSDSNYDSSEAVLSLERKGLRGDRVLLVGVTTGRADVSARVTLPDSDQQLVTSTVTITCVANLLLMPADVYVLAGTRLSYHVAQVKHGRLHPIDLSSSAYFLSVLDESVAWVNSNHTGDVTALGHGTTEVVLRDLNMAQSQLAAATGAVEAEAEAACTARLHVTQVARLSLTVAHPGGGHWLQVVGSRLALQCHLWSQHGNRLAPLSQNLYVNISVDSDYFHTDYRTGNGSYIEGVAVKMGRVPVKAVLAEYKLADGSIHHLEPPLSVSTMLELCAPLSVRPAMIVLPWDPVARTQHELQLHHTGGEGGVTWSVRRQSEPGEAGLAAGEVSSVVDERGVLRTRRPGHSEVTVALQRNPLLSATAQVYVVGVESVALVMSASVREASVRHEAGGGDVLLVPVAVQGRLSTGLSVNLTHCQSVALAVTTDSPHYSARLADSDEGGELPDGACRFVAVTGTLPGHTRLSVSLNTSSSTASASCLLGFFQHVQLPLAPPSPDWSDSHHTETMASTQQHQQQLLLAPGSWWRVPVLGGPLPWPADLSLHSTRVVSSDTDRVWAEYDSNYSSGPRVLLQCVRPGPSLATVTVTVTNTRHTLLLPRPLSSSAQLSVRCALPDTLQLLPSASVLPPTAPPVGQSGKLGAPLAACPQSRGTLTAHAHRPLLLRAQLLLQSGAHFHNASSLLVQWRCEHGCHQLAQLVASTEQLQQLQQQLDTTHSTRQLVPVGEAGLVTVRALVSHADPGADLVAQLSVHFVQPVQVLPTELLVFNHRHSRESLSVVGGSGHYTVRVRQPGAPASGAHTTGATGPSAVITHQLHAANRSVTVAPLAPGTATLQLFDVCLVDAPPALVTVKVSSVLSVRLSVVRRLSVGTVTEAQVLLLGAGNRPLPARLAPLVHLQLVSLTAGVLSVKPVGSGACHSGAECVLFEVHAHAVGEALLLARVGGRGAHSRTAEGGAEDGDKRDEEEKVAPADHGVQVEVFPPLELLPGNATVPLGSQLQLVTRGGPRGDTVVTFTVSQSPAAAAAAAAAAAEESEATLSAVTVTGHGLVQGERAGVARVVAQVSASHGSAVLSQASVLVRVAPVCGVSVRAPLAHIERRQRQPVYADAVDERGAPFAITVPLAEHLRLVWSSSQPHTAQLFSPLQPLGVSDDGGVVRHLAALSVGSTEVTVKLVGSRDSGCPHSNMLHSSTVITVYDSLRLLSVPLSTDSLAMAPGSSLQLRTAPPWTSGRLLGLSAGSSPSVAGSSSSVAGSSSSATGSSPSAAGSSPSAAGSSPSSVSLLTLASDGRLVAGDRTGHELVRLTLRPAHSAGHNLSLTLPVDLVPVHYLMITVQPAAGFSLTGGHVPTGVKFTGHIAAHDWRGRVLHSWLSHEHHHHHHHYSHLSVATNRHDLLEAESVAMTSSSAAEEAEDEPDDGGGAAVVRHVDAGRATVRLQMLQRGRAALTVTSGDTLTDTLFVSAAPLLPASLTELVVGEAVCLHTDLLSTGTEQRWSVDDTSVAALSPAPAPSHSHPANISGHVTAPSPPAAAPVLPALVARSVGSSGVTLHLPHGATAHTVLHVLPIAQLKLTAPQRPSVSVCSAEPYTLPLLVAPSGDWLAHQAARAARPGGRQCAATVDATLAPPVVCSLQLQSAEKDSAASAGPVSVEQLFSVHVQRRSDTGGFECVLTPHCPLYKSLPTSAAAAAPHPSLSSTAAAVSRLTADLAVTARVVSGGGSSGVTSAPVLLKLVPPVTVEPHQLQLSAGELGRGAAASSAQLMVHGTPDTLLGLSVSLLVDDTPAAAETTTTAAAAAASVLISVSSPVRVRSGVVGVTVSLTERSGHDPAASAASATVTGSSARCRLVIFTPVSNQRVTVPVTLAWPSGSSAVSPTAAAAAAAIAGHMDSLRGPAADGTLWLLALVAFTSSLATLGAVFLARWLWTSVTGGGSSSPRRQLLGPPPAPFSTSLRNGSGGSPYSPAERNGSSSGSASRLLITSPPRLWTEDTQPIHASPVLKHRSPPSSPHSL